MFSKKQILSAMAAVAMLALPVSAFANDWNHHNWNQHNRAVHNASVNHQIAGNAPVVGSRYAANRYGWTPRAGWNGAPAMRGPINVASPGYSPYAWNRYPHRWFAPASPYQAYAPAYPGYARPTYGYPPVGAMGAANCGPSAGYSGSTPGTSPSWLMTKRYNTMRTIAQLRARGDSRGAARLVPTVTALNQRIGGMNNQLGCGLAPASSLANIIPYNNRGYYNGAYANNQTVNTLSTIAVPMLSGIR
jgi:hypothetical protein